MTGKQKDPLGPAATLLAVTGMVTMIFSGGCSLLMLPMLWPFWPAVFLIGGVPFLLGGLTFWLASKYGQQRAEMSAPEEEVGP